MPDRTVCRQVPYLLRRIFGQHRHGRGHSVLRRFLDGAHERLARALVFQLQQAVGRSTRERRALARPFGMSGRVGDECAVANKHVHEAVLIDVMWLHACKEGHARHSRVGILQEHEGGRRALGGLIDHAEAAAVTRRYIPKALGGSVAGDRRVGQ